MQKTFHINIAILVANENGTELHNLFFKERIEEFKKVMEKSKKMGNLKKKSMGGLYTVYILWQETGVLFLQCVFFLVVRPRCGPRW